MTGAFLMIWGLLTIFLQRNIIRKEYSACLKKDNTYKWLREKTQKTPKSVIELAKSYKKDYEDRFN